MIKNIKIIGFLSVLLIGLTSFVIPGASLYANAAENDTNTALALDIDNYDILEKEYVKVVDNQFVLDQRAFSDARFSPLFLNNFQESMATNNASITEGGLTIDPQTKTAFQSLNSVQPFMGNYGRNGVEWHAGWLRVYLNRDVTNSILKWGPEAASILVGAIGSVAAGIVGGFLLLGLKMAINDAQVTAGVIVDVYPGNPIPVRFMGFQ